jgi:hypothetical protein
MADEKKPKERKKPVEPEAKAAADKKAPPVEVAEPAPPKPQTKSTKIPKLQKKDKSRLPRRQKKAQRKVTASQSKV